MKTNNTKQLRSIARIVRDCMGWMNGWSATQEAEQESAMKAAKRILAMTSKWGRKHQAK